MNDTYVNFKTAKLAKKVGFTKLQRFSSMYSLYSKDGEHIYYANYGFMGSGTSDGYISAPEQYFLEKWLRENFDIHISIRTEYFKDYKTRVYYYNIQKGKKNRDISKFTEKFEDFLIKCEKKDGPPYIDEKCFKKNVFKKSLFFKTYEECLEKALEKSLKLISNE